MMEFQKHRKYYLGNRYMYLLILLLAFFNAKAGSIIMSESKTSNELVHKIKYTYQLFYNQTNLDCSGTLDLSLTLPPNTIKLIFERTTPHTIDSDLDKLHFLLKSEYLDTSNLTIHDIYWGTYFRVCAIIEDGTKEYSPIYSINDYIEQDDLNSLLISTSVESIEIDKVNLQIENNTLYIYTPKTLYLSISDLSGKLIFNGNIQTQVLIPLEKITSPFIIVTYKTSDISKTKKLLIQ